MDINIRPGWNFERTTVDDHYTVNNIRLRVVPGPGIHIASNQHLSFCPLDRWDIIGILPPGIDHHFAGFSTCDYFDFFFYNKRTDTQRLVRIYGYFNKNVHAVLRWNLKIPYNRTLIPVRIDPESGRFRTQSDFIDPGEPIAFIVDLEVTGRRSDLCENGIEGQGVGRKAEIYCRTSIKFDLLTGIDKAQ